MEKEPRGSFLLFMILSYNDYDLMYGDSFFGFLSYGDAIACVANAGFVVV